jgi:ribosomal protein L44E
MTNRKLSPLELEMLFIPLITQVRERLVELSNEDRDLYWALRRKLYKELAYDERSKPSQRKKLKALKRMEQENKCAVCQSLLDETYIVLDRFEAMKGYTFENTRLLCQTCDTRIQRERGYK